jgi:hypothetical protein
MRKVSLAAMLAVLASLLMAAVPASAEDIAGPPSGDGIVPTLVDGNPSCQTLGYEFGFKIEGEAGSLIPANGTYPPSVGTLTGTGNLGLPGTLTISNSDGQFFNWSALFTTSTGVDAVIVKGGDNADSFVYVPEDTADTRLHAPFKDSETPRDISHVEFCYDLEASVAIDKTIPNVVTGNESIKITFVAVLEGADPSVLANIKGTCDVTFTATETAESCTITGLKPNTTYDIYETVTGGFDAQPSQQVTTGAGGSTVDGPTFTNTFHNATAAVAKATVPAGSEKGWTFDLFLDNDGTPGPSAGDELIDTVITTNANVTPFAKELVAEGHYYIAERPQEGFDSNGGNESCSFNVDYPAANGAVFDDCVFTNTQRGHIIIDKVTVPAGSTQSFEFDPSYGPNFNLKDADTPKDSGPLVPGIYSVAEVNIPAGWDLTNTSCLSSIGDTETAANIELDPGETVTCTFNDRQRGTIKVSKTMTNGSANQTFTFELRELSNDNDPLNPTDDTVGQFIASAPVTANNTPVQLNGYLVPGTYTICEVLPGPGWTSDLGEASQYTLTIDLDNSRVCADFTLTAGEAKVVAVANTQPGGAQLTIGFWKNHASCKKSSGGQAAVLDTTLVQAGTTLVGNLSLTGTTADCVKAVNVLNKTTIDGKTKKASDPLFNMAAQLLAARLNVTGGAGTCTQSTNAINAAQALLVKYNWNGQTYTLPLSSADATLANQLANTLDLYNNGNLC